MCAWVAVGIAGGSALLKLGEGAIQGSKANAIDKNNPYPNAAVQQEYQDNLRQAQQMAQQGMPAQQYNNQLSAINRNQAGGLYAAGNTTNPGASIAGIVRAGNDATGNLNAQDAVVKNQNMLRLLQERQQLAQQKDKAWDWNYQQKYLGNLAKSNALRGSSNANINSGLSDISGTALTAEKLGAFGNGGKSLSGTVGGTPEDTTGYTNLYNRFDNQSSGFNSFLGE